MVSSQCPTCSRWGHQEARCPKAAAKVFEGVGTLVEPTTLPGTENGAVEKASTQGNEGGNAGV